MVHPVHLASIELDPSAVSNAIDADGVSARVITTVAPMPRAAAKTERDNRRILDIIISSPFSRHNRFISPIVDAIRNNCPNRLTNENALVSCSTSSPEIPFPSSSSRSSALVVATGSTAQCVESIPNKANNATQLSDNSPIAELVKLCATRALFRHFVTPSVTKIVKFLGKIDGYQE